MKFPDADNGPWLILSLHYKHTDDADPQMIWLNKELSNTSMKCIIAFSHVHPFSSGQHGHDYKTKPETDWKEDAVAKRLFKSLYDHQASIFLAGHDHDYEQFPKRNSKNDNDKDKGVRSFVIGTGGYNLTAIHYNDNKDRNADIYKTYGVLRIDLLDKGYRWQFLSTDPHFILSGKVGEDTCNGQS